ncbi:hypothetical protein ABIF63_009793 [Bradyrhizobium japonicum]|uniref:Uncharacterized protein n=1 Tax=Bradyrhizobium japonicum TaxID=375 RepID=A0ABV2S933_BRAJP
MTIGLVLVATTKVEPLIVAVAAHAMRMSAMAGGAVGFVAIVPLKAFLSVAMPLAFLDGNPRARSIRSLQGAERRVDWKCPRWDHRFDEREQYCQGKEKTPCHISSRPPNVPHFTTRAYSATNGP